LSDVIWYSLVPCTNSTNSIFVRFLSYFSSTRGRTETLTMSQKVKWVKMERKKLRSSKVVMHHCVSKHLHCWPFQHLNASAHSLPWLSLLSCLPPPQCLQNPNFEILIRCITNFLHISFLLFIFFFLFL